MSKQVKHTPGPWHVRKCDGGYRLFDREDWAVVNDGLITPCLIWGGAGFKEGEANARLIAAAPDLLKALQVLIKINRDLDTVGVMPADKAIAYGMAEAAIAKATGGA